MDSSNTFGAILSSVPRQDVQYGFNTSGPWTTFYAYGAAGSDTNSNIQAWHMALGDGMGSSGSSEPSYSGNDQGFTQRKLVFASGNRVGVSKRMIRVDSNPTSYTGVGFILMPIRNPTGSTISCNINFLSSYYWTSGYEGASFGYFMPASTNAPYSTVSSGSWTSLSSTTGSSSVASSMSGSFNIPANTTVIVMGVSSYYYYTSYQFYETSMFYALSAIYNAGLICDMRMLATLAYGRFDNGYTSQGAHLAYPACAALFGDR